jgi:uncharacterized protein YjbI with pentapeptide repeats
MGGRVKLRRELKEVQDQLEEMSREDQAKGGRVRRATGAFFRWDGWSTVGTLVTAGAAIGALLFTGLTLRTTQEQFQDQYRLSEQGQFTDRFGRAIDQLGSASLEIRLGGIYSLERLGHDSDVDRNTVVEILVAFVRTHVAEIGGKFTQTRAGTAEVYAYATCQAQGKLKPDVQAAMTVIGRQQSAPTNRPVDLARLCLDGVDLPRANLSGISLSYSQLRNANLNGANLVGAQLDDANLYGAKLDAADLSRANMSHVKAVRASFQRARLVEAVVDGGGLSGADFYEADLTRIKGSVVDFSHASFGSPGRKGSTKLIGAVLQSANLEEAYLERADLTDAKLGGSDGNGGPFDYPGVYAVGASFRDANLTRTDLSLGNLTRANFKGANLNQTDFAGATLKDVIR